MNPVFETHPSRRTLAPLSQGSVLFMGANFQITEDNDGIFWDDTNKRFAVGTASPAALFHVAGDAIIEDTLFGDSAASGVLQLESTSDSTKGTVDSMDVLRLHRNLTTVGAGVSDVMTMSQDLTLNTTTSEVEVLAVTGTWTHTTAFSNSHRLVRAAPTLESSNAVLPVIPSLIALICEPVLEANPATFGTTATFIGYQCQPAVTINSTGTWSNADNPNITAVACFPDFRTSVTTGNYWAVNMAVNQGAGTFNDYIGIRIVSGAATDATNAYTIQSADSSFEIRHAGPAVFGANAAPTNSSTGLEVQSTTLAFLLPRMTTTQRNALTAVNGMVIYNTTTGVVEAREGGAWVNL